MFRASTLWPTGFILVAAFLGKTGWPLLSDAQGSLFIEFLFAFQYLGEIIILLFVFAVFASWYSLIVQKLDIQFPESIGRLHFWVTLIGVVTMYLPGYLIKMPRIITDSPADSTPPFFILTNAAGVCLICAGFVLFFRGPYKALSV